MQNNFTQNMTNYGELFCEAVDTIIKQRIEAIPYDSTYLCVIIDDKDRASGKYRVRKDQVEFDAYSSVTTYSKNMNVYVQVPNGDWNEQKLIVSQKVDAKTKPITYVSPFDSFVDITGNLITQTPSPSGLIANHPELESVTVWAYNCPNSDAQQKEEGLELAGYSRLGLKASFAAYLNQFRTVVGSYGLRLRIEAIPEDAETGTTVEEAYYDFIFDSADMVGNPMDFESYYSQDIVFNIDHLYKISKMELQFYQKAGSFLDYEDKLIPYQDSDENDLPPNLLVKDIYLSFGYDSNEFTTDTVVLYSNKNSEYSDQVKPEENNHKEIYARWIHKFENGLFKAVEISDALNYKISWYQESLGQRSDNAFSGVGWKPISRQTYNTTTKKYETTIVDSVWEDYNKVASNASYGLPRYPDYNQTWLIPDTSKQTEAVKAIIFYEDQHFVSNILTFRNQAEAINQATVNATSAAMIHCVDNSYGNYFIYDLGGSIVDHADSLLEREFKLYFNESFQEDETAAELTNAEVVEWVIPAVNTMIDVNGFLGGDSTTNPPDLEGYYHIKKYGDPQQRYDVVKNGANTQKYKIKSFYNQMYNNNTVKCIITKNNKTYTAVKELSFGPIGTSGTDYTFVLDFDKGVTALTNGSEDAVTVTAHLYDYEGREIISDLNGKHISWSWVKKDSTDINPYIGLMQGESLVNEIIDSTNFTVELQLKKTFTAEEGLPQDNYSVLKASLTDWGDYKLDAYLPIPIRSDEKYQFISGATRVCYGSLGYLDTYFQSPYEIHINNELPSTDEDGNIIPKLVESQWKIFSGDDSTNDDGEIVPDPCRPEVIINSAGQYILRPINIYCEDAMEQICIVGSVKVSGEDGEEEQVAVWSQPIFIYQNKYPSSIINDWDGQLKIDEKNNSILAAKIAAGKKESDNTFTGVMMGDWEGKDGFEDSATADLAEHTGLFGFQKGVCSFGFKDNGTAFIGKPGKGRLQFDGDKSIIQSNWMAEDKGGMLLDFDDGKIELQSPVGTEFKEDYFDEDIVDGTITINASAPRTPFKIGDSFSVDWDGSIWAKDGTFEGDVKADLGDFGDLYANDFYATNVTSDNLFVEYPYFTTIYFAPLADSQVVETYTYYIKNTATGKWTVATLAQYNAASEENRSCVIRRTPTSINGQTVYSGQLGQFTGNTGGFSSETTTVIGMRNVNAGFATVIEGSGNFLRIGNNSETDNVIIKGHSIRWHADYKTSKDPTTTIVGTGDGDMHYRFHVAARNMDFNLPTGNTDGKEGIVGIEGSWLHVYNIPADHQTGIYARFA